MAHYSITRPVARKPHGCGSCGRTIQPGERYKRGAGMDGTAWTWKECGHCDVLLEFVLHVWWDDEEYPPDVIVEWDPDGLAELRLKVLFRKQWRRADGTLYPLPVIEYRRQYYTKERDMWADRPARIKAGE